MDWSDENDIKADGAKSCFGEKTTIDCDEHLCHNKVWSCGDGQCINWEYRLVFQKFFAEHPACFNLRNINYMCELNSFKRAWTLPNGLCCFSDDRYDDRRLSMNSVTLLDDQKCIYLIRCALSDGFELDYLCNCLNCSYIMPNVCEIDKYYPYPNGRLIRPYLHTFYDWTSDLKDKMPRLIMASGNGRCRGYHGYFDLSQQIWLPLSLELIEYSSWVSLVCSFGIISQNYNSPIKFDRDCWKKSLTFNGRPYEFHDICTNSDRWISHYRINDGQNDCKDSDDEKFFISNKDLCSRIRKHRFQFSAEQPICFTMKSLGSSASICSNKYDQYLYGYPVKNVHKKERKGTRSKKVNALFLRKKRSSFSGTHSKTARSIPFRTRSNFSGTFFFLKK